jgi:hypothetical protein
VKESGGRRRKNRRGEPAGSRPQNSDYVSPYLPDAHPPRPRPWMLLVAAVLWLACIAGLVYVLVTG